MNAHSQFPTIEAAIAAGRAPGALDRASYIRAMAPAPAPDLNTPEAYAEAAKCWVNPALWRATVPHRGSTEFFIHGVWGEQQAMYRAAYIWAPARNGPFLTPGLAVERVAPLVRSLAA